MTESFIEDVICLNSTFETDGTVSMRRDVAIKFIKLTLKITMEMYCLP